MCSWGAAWTGPASSLISSLLFPFSSVQSFTGLFPSFSPEKIFSCTCPLACLSVFRSQNIPFLERAFHRCPLTLLFYSCPLFVYFRICHNYKLPPPLFYFYVFIWFFNESVSFTTEMMSWFFPASSTRPDSSRHSVNNWWMRIKRVSIIRV